MPTRNRLQRVRSSPLIDPAVCCLILLAPDQQTYAHLGQQARNAFQRKVSALTTAAGIIDVPVFVSWPGPDRQTLAPSLSPRARCQHFLAAPPASPWSNSDFVAAVDNEDRTDLLIGGFSLEYQVLTTSLHALAAGYDVYFLPDIVPTHSIRAAQSTQHRLMLQGARPALTSQVIHEWLLAAAKDDRAPLQDLLEPFLWPEADRGRNATPTE